MRRDDGCRRRLQLTRRPGSEADADHSVAGCFERLSHRVERECLAGAGSAYHDIDGPTRAAQLLDHPPLFIAQRRPRRRSPRAPTIGSRTQRLSRFLRGHSEHSSLGSDDLDRRPTVRPPPARVAAEASIIPSVRARISSRLAPWLAERATARTTSRRSNVACSSISVEGELVVVGSQAGVRATRGTSERSKRVVERPLTPLFTQLVLADASELGLACVERGDAGAVAGVDAEPLHLGDDLGASAGEGLAHAGADAGDLGDAVAVDLVEHEPEPRDEFRRSVAWNTASAA